MDAVLGADIGGTNTRIALFTPQLKEILSERYKTVGKNPYVALSAMNEFAMRNSISIKSACIAVAAPVVKDEAKLTNAKITISLKGIQRALGVKKAILINDFEAMALGITVLRKHEATALNKIQPEKNGVKAIIGAGTGLGKAILAYNDKEKIFIPLQSEEGHAQISIADKEEYGLLEFIKKMKKRILFIGKMCFLAEALRCCTSLFPKRMWERCRRWKLRQKRGFGIRLMRQRRLLRGDRKSVV